MQQAVQIDHSSVEHLCSTNRRFRMFLPGMNSLENWSLLHFLTLWNLLQFSPHEGEVKKAGALIGSGGRLIYIHGKIMTRDRRKGTANKV